MNKCVLCLTVCLSLMLTALLPQARAATQDRNKEAEAPQEAALAAPEKPQESRELWSGSLYTSSYRAGVCIDPESGKVRGVLLLRTMGGQVDTYHFWGSMDNGDIRASHSSGHNFQGRFISGEAVTGTITLKSGRNIELTGTRTQNAPLTDTCRPLPD